MGRFEGGDPIVLRHPAAARPARPIEIRTPLSVAAVVGALVFLVIGVVVGGTGSALPVDGRLEAGARWISGSTLIALVIDAGGESRGAIIIIVAVAGVCLAVGRWRLAVLTVAGQALIGGATTVVKPLFDRTIHEFYLSYPSGHTAGATAFGLVLGLLAVDVLGMRRGPATVVVISSGLGLGLVAAWAQTVLVAHYPTDTVGGLAMAFMMIPVAAWGIDMAFDHLLAAAA